MGWAHGPESGEIRPDGLYVKPKLSEAGLKNIAGGNLRYVSPVFDFDSAVFLGVDVRSGLPRYRVTRMTEAALTNKPNLKGLRPLSNRGHNAPGGEPGLGTPAEAATKEKNQTMKLINRALDLSPDASEEAAAAGIDKLKKERAEAGSALANREGELAEAKKELANRDSRIVELEKSIATAQEAAVEAELTASGITDPVERKTFGGMLLANRETGKAALNAVVAARKEASDARAAAAKPLTNRETAKTPEGQAKEVTGLARTQAAFAQAHNKQEEK
jgi:phage I-like protein